jgi:branched-chain amino acid transport system permease protein
MVTHFSSVWNRIGHGVAARLLWLVLLAGLGVLAHRPPALADEFDGAVKRCEELVPEFDEHPGELHHEVQPGKVNEPVGVRISWQRGDAPAGTNLEEWIICFFLPRSETGGAWQIDLMDTQKYGRLKRYDVQQLYKLRWLNEHYLPSLQNAPTEASSPQTILWLYFFQQTLNALTLGCLYALLAVGFTIVYNVTRIVNLAFGDLYMIGAFVTFICYVVVAVGGGSFAWPVAVVVLAVAMAVCGAASWVTDRLAFRHMRRAPTTVPMVASIGIAMIFRDVVRLSQGPKAHWMPPTPGTTWRIVEGLGYDVYLRKGHLMIGLATALVAAAFWWAGRHTKVGRGYRATAQDPRMAALVGVNVDRTIGVAFLIAGAMTGIAGVFAALQYQIVDFYMGYVIGFKALAAALLGGIGSLEGAFLGGMLIAAIETYAGMAFGYEWRELAVFSAMALVLIFRPGGIFGTLRNAPADERV